MRTADSGSEADSWVLARWSRAGREWGRRLSVWVQYGVARLALFIYTRGERGERGETIVKG